MAGSHGVPKYTADEALARLKEGNARFLNGEARFPTVQKEVLAELARGQEPYVTILGCSDSRVPPELLFDAGFGELFVVRVAGNVLGHEILGTLQYAATHLQTPLFVVLGHEGCGAVLAAVAAKFEGARHRSRIEVLLENIMPALDGLDETLPPTPSSGAPSKPMCAGPSAACLRPEGQRPEAEGDKTGGCGVRTRDRAVRFLNDQAALGTPRECFWNPWRELLPTALTPPRVVQTPDAPIERQRPQKSSPSPRTQAGSASPFC
jgi:carbonic anhydrase